MPYAAAGLAVAAASLVSALLLPLLGTNILFVTYMMAVIYAARYGGVRPALFATALGYLVANLAFVPERDQFVVNWGTAAYFLGCAAIAFLGESTRRARRRAATSAQHVVALVESISDAFVAVDDNWRSTYMNRAAQELARQSGDFRVGAPLWDAFPPAAGEAAGAKIRRAVAAGQTVEFECFHEPWQAWFEIKVSPAEDRTAVFLRDITARKLNQMALAQSEERLRRAQQGARAGLWDWDMQSGLVTWSDEYYDINGLDPATTPSREIWMRSIYAEDRPGVERAIAEAIEKRQRIDIQYRVEHPARGLRWIAARGQTTCDAAGTPLRTSGIVLDITERKRAERALAFLSETGKVLSVLVDFESAVGSVARLAVDSMADYCVVAAVDPLARIERLAAAHHDVAKEPLLRRALERDPLDGDSAAPVVQVLRTGTPALAREVTPAALDAIARDEPHRRLLDELAPGSWMIVPLLVRERVIGAIEFVSSESRRHFTAADLELAMEVAGRVAAAADNVRLYTELRQSERQKDDFLAMLAHELRNPLAAIQYANQLSKISATQDAGTGEVIDRQVSNLAHLIEDLLDVSRITRDKIQLRKKIVDGRQLFERALTTARPAIEERGHELAVELADEPMPIHADAVRVEQILVNLLTNAAKYTPEKGRIAARAFPHDGQAVFRVKDTGIGIPQHMLPRVFDLFTQVDPSLERTEGGLGIGLTVVRKLAEMHGGSVSAASEGLGQGSEFVVRLPLCAAEPAAERTPSAEISSRPLRVLVVDDNVDMAQGLARLLTQLGHTVTMAHDGHAALAAARRIRPEVIVLDIGLPGLDGYSVAEALRREPELAGMRLVAVSGYGRAEDKDRTKAAGFDHHLVKPVDFGQLVSVISQSEA
jgi:PAS domain S-box-containing protein